MSDDLLDRRCPMRRIRVIEACALCFRDPEGIEECLERAADFESLLTQLNEGDDE
jgi:hypothetical protein